MLPRELEAVLPRHQHRWLLAEAQSLRSALDETAEPLVALTEQQAAESLLEHVSAQESLAVDQRSVNAHQQTRTGRATESQKPAAAVGRAFSLKESKPSARSEPRTQTEAPASSGNNSADEQQQEEVYEQKDDDEGWMTESDADSDSDNLAETTFRDWTARFVAQSFQEYKQDTRAHASPVPSADSPATAAIAAFRQRVPHDSASDGDDSHWLTSDHEQLADGSESELSWAAADRRDGEYSPGASDDDLSFPATRRLSSPSSPPSACLDEWRRRRSAGVAGDKVTIAHEHLQDALSPPPSGVRVRISSPRTGGDEGEVADRGGRPSGSPPFTHAAASSGRPATAIQFSSPLESREKFRTPSPASKLAFQTGEHCAQQTTAAQGLDCSGASSAEGDYEEDSEGWVTDDGGSADDELEPPQQQRWHKAASASDSPDRQYYDHRSAEAADAAAAGSTKWSVLDGFLRRREQRYEGGQQREETATGSRERKQSENVEQQLHRGHDVADSNPQPSRTTSHASPQERRGRTLLPRGQRAGTVAEPVQPARHDADLAYLMDRESSQFVEPARHSAPDDDSERQRESERVRRPHAQAAPPASEQQKLASEAALARQKWRARALSPTTPIVTHSSDTGPSDGSTAAPWSDAVTPVDEPGAHRERQRTASASGSKLVSGRRIRGKAAPRASATTALDLQRQSARAALF